MYVASAICLTLLPKMPVYDIEHIVSLTDGQKDQLADAITKVHSEKFSTPRLFVNVNFKDISSIRTYVGGKHVSFLSSISKGRSCKVLITGRDRTIAS